MQVYRERLDMETNGDWLKMSRSEYKERRLTWIMIAGLSGALIMFLGLLAYGTYFVID